MKILVPLAEGFEEIEAVSIIDVLRRAEIETVTACIGKNPVRGAHDILVSADRDISGIEPGDFTAVVLPGGMPGSANLRDSSRIISIIREINERKGIIAALCAAPIVLAEAGIIEERKVTCFPGFEKELHGAEYNPEPVMIDNNIITGRGPGCAIPFALTVVEVVSGKQVADALKKQMQVYWM